MSYAEWAPPPWIAKPVACVWRTLATGRGGVLPDACVDLIHVEGRGTFVAGPDTRPAEPRGVRSVAGLRLRPGHAAAVLGVPAAELRDRRVGLEELWGSRGAELAAPRRRRAGDGRAPRVAVGRGERRPPDPLALGAVALLARDPGRRVADLAAQLAVSERHLLRRVRAAIGYGPKTLARIVRFQRLLALAETSADGLADLALAAGYADQPHMTGEVRRLAGAPPCSVLGSRAHVGTGSSCRDGVERRRPVVDRARGQLGIVPVHRVRHVGHVDELEPLACLGDERADPRDLLIGDRPMSPPVSGSISRKWWVSSTGVRTAPASARGRSLRRRGPSRTLAPTPGRTP